MSIATRKRAANFLISGAVGCLCLSPLHAIAGSLNGWDSTGLGFALSAAGSAAGPSNASAKLSYPSAEQVYTLAQGAKRRYAYRGRVNTTYWRTGSVSSVIVSSLPPDRLRIDYVEPDSVRGSTVVKTSTDEWTWSPVRQVLSHRKISIRPTAVSSSLNLLKRNYLLSVSHTLQVWADRKSYELQIIRRSNNTVARRLWVDQVTGLVLKRETFGEDGKLGTTIAYADIDFHPNITAASFDLTALERRSGVRKVEDRTVVAVGIDRGAQINALNHAVYPKEAGGYKFVSASTELIGLRPTVHLRYTDGLDLLSLFEQTRSVATRPTTVPTAMSPAQVDGKPAHYIRRASLATLIWDSGPLRLTVLGEPNKQKLLGFATAIDQYIGTSSSH